MLTLEAATAMCSRGVGKRGGGEVGARGNLNRHAQLQGAVRSFLFLPEASGLAEGALGLVTKYKRAVGSQVLSVPALKALTGLAQVFPQAREAWGLPP